MASVAAQKGVPLGRYVLHDEIAAGGMACVHLARQMGAVGFSRTVAIKRLHRHLANDDAFRAMFLDEARLAARIRHPNVVPILDVVTVDGDLFLVMEYVHGESLAKLHREAKAAGERIPLGVVSAVMVATLHGLHAAHEAKSESGEPLGIVHRDVSPQNILVGADGVVRVLDFGIAKAMGRLHTTRDGEVKGKAAYMAPEQLRARPVDARTDVYAASVVLWELLTGERLFAGDSPEAIMNMVLERVPPPPSARNPSVPPALDELVVRGLSRDPEQRFESARDMAIALESIVPPVTPRTVGEWAERTSGEVLSRRAAIVADIESRRSLGDESAPSVPASGAHRAGPISSTAMTTAFATPQRLRDPRSSALVAFFAFAVAAVALGVALWSFVTFRRAPSVAASAARAAVAPAAPEPPPASTASPPASGAVADAPPSAPLAALSASVANARRAPSSARPAAASAARRVPARPAPAPSSPSRKCDKPYVIDANGDRTPRPECL